MSILYCSIPDFITTLARQKDDDLQDRPLIVLDPEGRVWGVSAEAAACGVAAGMAARTAGLRCPEARLLGGDVVLQRRFPSEDAGYACISQLERDRLVLHQVYEKFVAKFYGHHLRHWEVRPQLQLKWHAEAPNRYLPGMRADLFLEERATGRIIILDTKFTAKSLKENQWGKEMFDSSHLYQIYAYLRTQEHLSDGYRQATGILLYPAIREDLSERVQLQTHQIRIECVDLAAPWQTVEQRLLDLIVEHV